MITGGIELLTGKPLHSNCWSPVVIWRPPVINRSNHIIPGGFKLLSGGLYIITSGLQLLCGGLQLITAGLYLSSGGHQLLTGGPQLTGSLELTWVLHITGDLQLICDGLEIITGGEVQKIVHLCPQTATVETQLRETHHWWQGAPTLWGPTFCVIFLTHGVVVCDPKSIWDAWRDAYIISQEICTRFCCALLCCGYAIVHNEFTWSIYPYSSGLLCWHWGNR